MNYCPNIFRLRKLCMLLASLTTICVLQAAEISSNGVRLVVSDSGILVEKDGNPIIELDELKFDYYTADSWEIKQVNDEHIQVLMDFPAAVVYHQTPLNAASQTATLDITIVEGGFRLHSAPSWSNQTTLVFKHLDDHFFGLSAPLQPDNQLSPDLSGASVRVEVASEGESIVENYASAFSSFYMSSHGYGAFFDSFARGRYDFAINGKNKIHHDTGKLNWYLFFGDNGSEIQKSYFSLIGSPKKLPVWGVGPVAWRDQNNGGAEEIIADIEGMNELEIPITAWFVDRPYSDGAHAWSEMNFNENFTHPEVWIKRIREEFGIEFMTWTATSTFGDARFEKHLNGKFTYLDLSHEPSVAAYQEQLAKNQYVFGVKGHKIDRADEAFPLYEDWHDKTIYPPERRNRYVYLFAKIHDEALRAAWGEDQVTFARAAIHRAQPYLSAIWGGDPRSSWEGMRGNMANAIRSSFMGFPVWGTDVGGYIGDGYIPEDLYLRWMQFGSMSGLFEIKLDGSGGQGPDRMPWRYDEAFQSKFKAICDDRMNLLPYLYSLANTSAESGVIMQPMAYRHFEDAKTYSIWDQYYVGEAILVAPVTSTGTSREVYLPAGNWRNYDNLSEQFEGGKTITVEAPLDHLPRFVPENSVFVTGSIYDANQKTWDTPEHNLVIHAIPGKISDKQDFTYIDLLDSNNAKKILLERNEKTVTLSSPSIACPTTVEIVLNAAPKKISLNGRKVKADLSSGRLSVKVPDGEAIELEITLK